MINSRKTLKQQTRRQRSVPTGGVAGGSNSRLSTLNSQFSILNLMKATVFISLMCAFLSAGATIRYVKTDGTTQAASAGGATSWAYACNDLQAVINASVSGDEIRVAAGTYKPNRRADATATVTANDRDNAFVLKDGVKIYGGFAATGNPGMNDRQPLSASSAYLTVLSGDINANGTSNDNCYHVVVGANTLTNATRLDGFTVTGGYSGDLTGNPTTITVNGQSVVRDNGGGIYLLGHASPTLENLTITGNATSGSGGGGGGIYLYDNSSPVINNAQITGNTANEGGGLRLDLDASVVMTNVQITGNTTTNGQGGGIYINSGCLVTLTNGQITGNKSNSIGGGIHNHSGGRIVLTNVQITGNTAGSFGGGISRISPATSTLTNVTVAGNYAGIGGGGIYGVAQVNNSIIWGNTATTNPNVDNTTLSNYSYSLVEDAPSSTPTTIISIADPKFVNFVQATSTTATSGGDFSLKCGSPAIDMGQNSSNTYPTDLTGNVRIQGGTIDLGAYEALDFVVPDNSGRLYVKQNAAGNGSSWANALGSLSDALLAARRCSDISEIWVAAGTYKPTRRADNQSPANPNDRDNAFVLVDGVKIYGGFDANGNPGMNDRQPSAYPTVLSGDINTNAATDNCYHVVVGAGTLTTATTRLDGFTVTGGYSADITGQESITVNGQSVYNYFGGGISLVYASPALENLTVTGNTTGNGSGGGIFIGSTSSPVINNVQITDNTAGLGGGLTVSFYSLPILTNVKISGNTAATHGGGIYLNGGTSTLTNIQITGNTANSSSGGGIYVNAYNGLNTLTNVTIAGNRSGNSGGGISFFGGSLRLYNSIVWGNTAATGDQNVNNSNLSYYSYSLVEGMSVSSPNIVVDDNPQFVGFVQATNVNSPTSGGDFSLKPVSTAINAGLNSNYTSSVNTDLAGNPRIRGCNIDLGAYEAPDNVYPDGRLYVKTGATGNGTSWATALGSLSEALFFANTCKGISEIWVAAGTYKPTRRADNQSNANPNTDRDNAFVLIDGVKIYGGFPATGDPGMNDRQPLSTSSAYRTILSGDINTSGNTDNVYHVVVGANTLTNATRLDGFTVTGGYSEDIPDQQSITVNGQSVDRRSGGGICLWGNASPALENLTITGNATSSVGLGGGIYIYNNSSPVVINNVQITGNTAGEGGGLGIGLYASVVMTNGQITGNTTIGAQGGGIYINSDSRLTLTNGQITGNKAQSSGGGIHNHQGIIVLTNVQITGNTASSGGGGINIVSGGTSTLTNVTVAGNYAGSSGGGIYGGAQVNNSIIYGNTAGNTSYPNVTNTTLSNYSYSLVEGMSVSSPNIVANADPKFVNFVQATSTTATSGGDFSLKCGSPAINAGLNGNYTSSVTTDLAGSDRIQGSAIDLGAYETLDLVHTNGRLYVKTAATGTGKGSSWADALGSLSDALLAARRCSDYISEIWVAAGTYKPTRRADSQSAANPDDRDNAFVLVDGVKIYGGFAATGNPGMNDRQPLSTSPVYQTILSGDVGANGDNTDNVYHVVVGADALTAATTRLDGFTVTGGYSEDLPGGNSPSITVNGQSVGSNRGGGISLWGGASPTLENLTVTGNATDYDGSGIYIYDYSDPVINRVKITGNTTIRGNGGGIAIVDNCSPVLTNVQITDNSAWNYGGGIHSQDATFTLTNGIISGNTGQSTGSYGGGIYIYDPSSLPVLINVQITGNTASEGGGICGSAKLTNVTIAGNYASYRDGGISGAALVNNSIIWGNTAATGNQNVSNTTLSNYSYSLVEDATTTNATQIISNADPKFVNLVKATSATGATSAGDVSLQCGSPALNAGLNSNYTSSVLTDLAGNPRFVGVIDLGAYELQKTVGAAGDISVSGTTTICYGRTTSLTASASGITGTPTFRWYASQSITAVLHTGETFTTPALTATTKYYVSVSAADVCENDINTRKEVTVTVNPDLTGGAISDNQTICYGNKPAPLTGGSASGGGGTYAYLWQSSTNNSTFSTATGANSTETAYAPPALTQTTYYRRRVISGSTCDTAYSNTVTVTVNSNLTGGTISDNQTICYGAKPAPLTGGGTVSGGGGNYTYLWQSSTDNTNFGAATSPNAVANSYTETAALTQTTYYRRRVISGSNCDTAYSNTVTVEVLGQLTGGKIGTSKSICYNGSAGTLTNATPPAGGGTSYTYQWQSRVGSDEFANVTGANGATYTPAGTLTVTTQYRRITTSVAGCGSAYSDTVTVTVYGQLTGGKIGTSTSICYNTSPGELTDETTPSGGINLSYQWQSRVGSSSSFANVSNATSLTYTPGNLTQTTYYRRMVTSGSSCGTAYSDTVTVTVKPYAVAGDITVNETTICYGKTASLTASLSVGSSVTSPQFKWYTSQTDPIAVFTGATYDTPALTANTTYYVSVSGTNHCENVVNTRRAVTVTVLPQLAGGTIDASQTIISGQAPAPITSTPATGGTGTYIYRWEQRVNGAGIWTEISGATGTGYNPPALTTPTQYRRKATSGSCDAVYSDTVTILPLSPLSLQYTACPGASVTMGFNTASGVTYGWYTQPTDGSPVTNGTSATLTVTKGSSGTETWWVEATWNGVTLPRYRVDLMQSDCDVTDPTGCAAEGTVIWKEDFDRYGDGLNPASAAFSSEELPDGMTTYTFVDYIGIINPFPHTGIYTTGNYALVKDAFDIANPTAYTSRFRDDHTSPADSSEGRFFLANGRDAADRVYRQTVDDLCPGAQLYFSFWLSGHNAIFEWTIYAEPSNEVLVKFNMPALSAIREWKNYGFNFTIPDNVSSIRFEIFNNCANTSGNDFAVDDVEIRLCAPAVTIAAPAKTDTTVCVGTSFTMSGNYTDNPPTFGNALVYRWERNTTADVNDLDAWLPVTSPENSQTPGSIASTYTIDPVVSTDAGYYRLVVANAANIDKYNCRAMSDIIRLRITGLNSGTVSPGSQTVCYNSPATLTSTESSGGSAALAYQWQRKVGSTWTNIQGATDLTYTTPSLTATAEYRLQTVGGTAACETVYSNPVTVTVLGQLTGGKIGTSKSICYGGSAGTLSATTPPTGGATSYTYQWQSRVGTSGTFSSVGGATSSEYSPGTLTQTMQYLRITTSASGCGSAYSDTVTVMVYGQLTGGKIGTSQDICYGGSAGTLSETTPPTGGATSYTYQWQSRVGTSSTFSSIAGATLSEYTPGNLTQTMQYLRITISAGTCGSASSDTVTVTVYGQLKGGKISGNQTVCYNTTPGTNLTTSTAPSGGKPSYTYQWKSSTDGTNFGNAAGTSTNETYTFPGALTQTTYYLRLASDAAGCGTASSDTVKITVYGKLSQQAASPPYQAVCHNNAPNILNGGIVGGGSGSYSYLWEQSDDDGVTWNGVSLNGTSPDYQPPALTQTLKYRRIVSSDGGSCGRDTSNVLTVKVYPQAILNYPDFRIWACPVGTGGEINLSKYLDTIESPNIVWGAASGSPAINASGIIDADKLVAPNTYTYTYTVTNPCIVSNMTRKIYLKMLGSNGLKQPQDTVTICYETAEAVNINQIFGIDAGGTWMYDPVFNPYITLSTSPEYDGAVVMNGRGIYKNNIGADYTWHGMTVKKVEISYTPAAGSCLSGKTFKRVIILTPDMM